MRAPKVRSEPSDSGRQIRRQALSTENPQGKRIVDALNGRSVEWLSEKSKIKRSTLSDCISRGVSRADNAVAIAAALGRSVEWLITGREGPPVASLVAADEADWVTIDEFDLRELTEEGKGPPHAPSPFRKDWLNQTLGTASGLWLTRLLSDYPALGLAEGAHIFCVDVEPAELLEGQLCLFRINGGLVTGRFSFRAAGGIMSAGDRLGEVIITRAEIGREENHYIPVARILGRLFGRV